MPGRREGLLEAIEGAFQVWDENDDTHSSDHVSDEEWTAHEATWRTTFAYLVEDVATAHKSRLGLR